MEIISHRGYWTKEIAKNSSEAFENSFRLGFGTETDIRDVEGKLVISHDMPKGGEMPFDEFIQLFASFKIDSVLALNIKADGLALAIKNVMSKYPSVNYFCFDMSVPDMRDYIANNIPLLTRKSEVELSPAFLIESSGIWLDSFFGNWFDEVEIENSLSEGKYVCVVSSELHKRDYKEQWRILKSFSDREKLILCTDVPELAIEYFKG